MSDSDPFAYWQRSDRYYDRETRPRSPPRPGPRPPTAAPIFSKNRKSFFEELNHSLKPPQPVKPPPKVEKGEKKTEKVKDRSKSVKLKSRKPTDGSKCRKTKSQKKPSGKDKPIHKDLIIVQRSGHAVVGNDFNSSYNSLIASLKTVHTRNFSTSSEPEYGDKHNTSNNCDETDRIVDGWVQEASPEGKKVNTKNYQFNLIPAGPNFGPNRFTLSF